MPKEVELIITNDHKMEVEGKWKRSWSGEKMLDFQCGLYGAGRVTTQVAAICFPPHSFCPGPQVTTSSPFCSYQARNACRMHVISLPNFSHKNNSSFLTLYLSKTGKETFSSSFSQFSIKYVLPLLIVIATDLSETRICEELAFSSDQLPYKN